jgi:hypothetical protein
MTTPAPDQIAALVIAQEHARATGEQAVAALHGARDYSEAADAFAAFVQANQDVADAFREATT